MKLNSLMKIGFSTGLLLLSTHTFAETDTTETGISRPTSATPSGMEAKTPADDAAITQSLTNEIKKSKVLSDLNVKVNTVDGVVHLEGNVDSDTQVSLLVEQAEMIVGVTDVDTSKLTVKDSEQPLADTIITAKIRGLLIREKLFGEKDVAAINTSVETKDGVVYLSGFVDNKEQIENARQIIKKSVPEVKEVEYKVRVNLN